MIAVPAITATFTGEQALTEIEALGLRSRHDMANGHASQELSSGQQKVIANLSELWYKAAEQKSADAEAMFKSAFATLAQTPSVLNYSSFKICPTASNSIDTIACWLAEHKLKTALIEPTFDNLALILKRRGVELIPLCETAIHSRDYVNASDSFDALFLVNPNNPTGRTLTETQVSEIAQWCATHGKVLVLDNTFRFFAEQSFDLYQILLDSEVTFLSIEDTGKVWPTQEIKASLLFCSTNIFKEIAIIYDEVFLCHSNFALQILSAFLLNAHQEGLDKAIWQEVAQRRSMFRSALQGSGLQIHSESHNSTISVEWVAVNNQFADDLALAEYFKDQGLIVLPGRQFFWSRKGVDACSDFVRFALLKPKKEFLSAMSVISSCGRRS